MSMENPRRDSGGSVFGDNNSLFGGGASSSSDLPNSASSGVGSTTTTATTATISSSKSLSTPSTANVTLMSNVQTESPASFSVDLPMVGYHHVQQGYGGVVVGPSTNQQPQQVQYDGYYTTHTQQQAHSTL